MHTLRLKISDKVFDKLVKLLKKFNKDEVEIIDDHSEFIDNQKYLQKEYSEIVDGKPKYIELDQANVYLEDIIKKNEGSL